MRFKNREIFSIKKGNNYKSLKAIDNVAEKEQYHPFITQAINRYGLGPDMQSIRTFFNALYRILPFYPDPETEQIIRTVNRSLKDGVANCVDYTVFLSAFLRRLKIPHKIRMVNTYNTEPGFNHILVVLNDGTFLDLVGHQSQDGSEINKKVRTLPVFGKTVPYFTKHDKIVA